MLILASFSSATSVSQQAELAIAEFKSKIESLFGNADNGVQNGACSYSASGATFDWSSIQGKTFEGGDPTDGDQHWYSLTMCGTSPKAECAQTQGSICQYSKSDRQFIQSLGSFYGTPAPTYQLIKAGDPSSGVEVVLRNGDKCRSGWTNVDPVVTLRLTCGSEDMIQVDETNQCEFIIEFVNKATCKGAGFDDDLSGGAIFLIVLMVSAVLYVGVGCGICYKKYEKRGLDACPHKDFWFALPGLVKDGVVFSIGKIKTLFGSKTITTSAGEYESA